MCFGKNKEKNKKIETIEDYALMFKHRNFDVLNERVEYTKKTANILNNLIQSAIEYGKNINNTELIEQPGGGKATAADIAKHNLMLSMVKCQMEDENGLFSFCNTRGFKPGETPEFEIKINRNFFN